MSDLTDHEKLDSVLRLVLTIEADIAELRKDNRKLQRKLEAILKRTPKEKP